MEQYNHIARGVVDPFLRVVNERWGPDLSDVPRMFVVMRGLPGSGKTTLAETIVEYAGEVGAESIICSANNFFTNDGVFEFNVEDLGRAHEDCFNRCLAELNRARDLGPDIIIIDNTNLQTRDFERYANLPHDPDWLEVMLSSAHTVSKSAAVAHSGPEWRSYDTRPQVDEVAWQLARKLYRPAEPLDHPSPALYGSSVVV